MLYRLKNHVAPNVALAPLQPIVTTVYVLSRLEDQNGDETFDGVRYGRYIVTDRHTAIRWAEESIATRTWSERVALDVNGTYVLIAGAATVSTDPFSDSPPPQEHAAERISWYP